MNSDIFDFENCEYNCLYIKDSSISKFGCFTTKVIPADTFIVEYKGDIISSEDAYKRESDPSRPGIYTFWVNDNIVIDGCDNGNIARYINHSCDPNCYYTFKGNRVLIFALKDIFPNEELTIDYCYDSEGEKITCTCGSQKCRGFINSNE
jgi:SET domain-containing protein